MSKNIRIVVSVLFAVIIVLAVAISRFYFNVSKDAGSSGNTEEIVQRLSADADGNRIFEGTNGLYGVADANDRVIVAPEWTELSFAGNQSCIASKRIGGRLLSGCINYDGNIIVPFIYRNIIRSNAGEFTCYIAETEDDGSFVIYDEKLTPCFMRAWDSCTSEENELYLESGESRLTYTAGEDGFVCKRAKTGGEALGCEYELNVSSRVLLSSLDCSKLEAVSEGVSAYLEFAYTGNYERLGESAGTPASGSFTMIFPGEDRITRRKLLGVSDIFIYSETSETGEQYFNVSLMAETEITYRNEDGSFSFLSGEYKASVRFAASETSVKPVSGSFIREVPDYPVEEDTTENSVSPEETA